MKEESEETPYNEYLLIRDEWLSLIDGKDDIDTSDFYFRLTEIIRSKYPNSNFTDAIVLFSANLLLQGPIVGRIPLAQDDYGFVHLHSPIGELIGTLLLDQAFTVQDEAVKFIKKKFGQEIASDLECYLDNVPF